MGRPQLGVEKLDLQAQGHKCGLGRSKLSVARLKSKSVAQAWISSHKLETQVQCKRPSSLTGLSAG
jgi:hypothetical protein